MRRTLTIISLLALFLTGTFLAGCDDSSSGSSNATGDTTGDGATTADGDPADTGGNQDGSTTNDSTTTADNGVEDDVVVVPNPGAWDRTNCSGLPSGAATFPATVDLAEGGGTRDVRLIVEAISFDDDFFIMRNISGSDITFSTTEPTSGDPTPWTLFVRAVRFDLPTGYVLRDGFSVAVHMRRSGSNDQNNIFIGASNTTSDLEPDAGSSMNRGGEVAILQNPNDPAALLSDPDNLEAFVRYGGNSPGGTASLRDEAASVGLWQGNGVTDFVAADAGAAGLIAIGDVTTTAGWAVADVDCFAE